MQFEKITKRVEAVCKVLREEALANHKAGTVLPRTLEALRESGILACNVPESAGGWGLGVANDRAVSRRHAADRVCIDFCDC